jgi:predicted nucleic acid-binding protein
MVQTGEALVIDASVAAKWHLTDEPDADAAAQLLSRFTERGLTLLAPTQIRSEVPSSITVATLGTPPRLTRAEAEAAIAEFLALDLSLTDDTALALDAFRLVHQHGIAYYDALYVALALRHGVPFVTADRKLHSRISQLPGVVWVTNWAAR